MSSRELPTSLLHAPTWSDFQQIARALVANPDPWDVLDQVGKPNEKLAETLLLFMEMLRATTDQDQATQRAYMHYVINTDGPLPRSDDSEAFDVFEWASAYAASLQIDISQTPGGTLLSRGLTQHPCASWTNQPGESASLGLRGACRVLNRFRYGRDDVIPSTLFPFDAHASIHSKPNAMWMADLSALAYHDQGFVERQLQHWGYGRFAWITPPESQPTDTEAFVAAAGDHAVVGFRGTSSLKDVLTDLSFGKVAAPGGRGKVHGGFARSLESVWASLEEAVAELGSDLKLFVTGHSLGAALAQLAAFRWASAGREVAGVYVFGSPRAGDKTFAGAYNDLLEQRSFVHVNNDDAVTRIPPKWLGFRHLGDPGGQFLFDRGHAISRREPPDEPAPAGVDPDGDGEAPVTREMMEVAQSSAKRAETAIKESNRYLIDSPVGAPQVSYGAVFETGAADDHGINQYLFKFACSIVEDKWQARGSG